MQLPLTIIAVVATQLGLTTARSTLSERDSTPSLSSDAVLPFYNLPTLLDGAATAALPFSPIEAIRQTLALYPLSIDGKNFDALKHVFVTNVVANYSAPLNVLTPLSTVDATLKSSLAPVTTQHLYGTQSIDLIDCDHAYSVTYFQATHFGMGPIYSGQTATAFGQYQDRWLRQSDGSWKITHRNLVYMGPLIGNLLIFTYKPT